MAEPFLYAGLSGTSLGVESFDLGRGVRLVSTYAHLFSPYIMAFAPPGPQGHHPAPWQAAKSGYGFDISIELQVPNSNLLANNLDARETIWWIAALLRIIEAPQVIVPVTSTHSFASAKDGPKDLALVPFEVTPRMFQFSPGMPKSLSIDSLNWVRNKWEPAGQLLSSNAKFFTALKAFDSATVLGKSSSAMLALWGGLEQLFAPSAGELRFRVSALLAAYDQPPGKDRLDCFKRVLKLYDQRSQAAHTASEVTAEPLMESYVLMRNVLVRMIDECEVPTQEKLQQILFGVTQSENADDC
jgi:hypothetical protein